MSTPNASCLVSESLASLRRLTGTGQVTQELTSAWAQAAAAEFMAHRRAPSEDIVPLLCEIALLDDEHLSRPGTTALFSQIIEPLADSFDPFDCGTYYRIFARVIEICRRTPGGENLDERLNHYGLRSEHDLLNRVERMRAPRKLDPAQAGRIRKAIVLSRVTLGADVEITSIILQKLQLAFPSAQIVLLAGEKAAELFGGDPHLKIHALHYHRGGGLTSRLTSWLTVISSIEHLSRDLQPGEVLIVDPDSRLTQLGLLPVMADESYSFFFESRTFQRAGLSSLGQLTARWVNEVFGEGDQLHPCVHLRKKDKAFGEAIVGRARSAGTRRIVSINFGVGDNEKKRLSEEFERRLVTSLLESGSRVILDKGFGSDEAARVDRITFHLREQGLSVSELNDSTNPDELGQTLFQAPVITWQGRIGRWSALVAHTDHYLGYDSAGQHISAALEVPTIVIFAGSPSSRFVDRWQPSGRGRIDVIVPEERTVSTPAAETTLVEEVVRLSIDERR